MTPRPVTLDLVARLERETGFPVQVTALGSLGALASVRPARGASGVHQVLYNPLAEDPPDYLIAHPCGVALRMFSLPPEARFEIGPFEAGRDAVARDLAGLRGVAQRLRLSDEQVAALRDKLYGGLMLQLGTTPIGLRVDRWLWETCPELRDVQETATRQLLADNVQLLEPEVRAMTPPRALAASLAMNAATAAFWARVWGEPALVDSYRPSGSHRDGGALLRLWDMLPDDPARDRELVDGWADMLGIAGWYEWRPFPTPGAPPPAA